MSKLSSRPVIITGNWKMHKTVGEALDFVKNLAPLVSSRQVELYLAVPFTAIHSVATLIEKIGCGFKVGAQNMNDAREGAFTGEIAASMLKDAKANFVLLGHSERRHLFKENNEFIHRKVARAFQEGLQPVLCIGETNEEKEANQTETVLKRQIHEGLNGFESAQLQKLILAYEPVWAIGTGKHARPEDAEATHQFCRRVIQEKWGEECANRLVVQYGGSVNRDNAHSFLKQPNIDGLLVGGASLKVDSFSEIVNVYQGHSI